MIKKYRKKPVVIEAVQWFVNGDHPDDESVMVKPDPRSTTQFEPFLSEGKLVRYYRDPTEQGSSLCDKCGKAYNDHGWIDTLEGGHRVCTGDWIIKGVKGEFYPCKPDIFEMTYEQVSIHDPEPSKEQANPKEVKSMSQYASSADYYKENPNEEEVPEPKGVLIPVEVIKCTVRVHKIITDLDDIDDDDPRNEIKEETGD